jgi:hypothetical protein
VNGPAPSWPPPDEASRATSTLHGPTIPTDRRNLLDTMAEPAGAAGLVLLGLAGLLVFLARPSDDHTWTRFDDHIDCGSGRVGMLAVVSAVMVLAEVAILVIGLVQISRSRPSRSTLVGFCGLSLNICGVAAMNLWIQADYAASSD